MRQLVLPDIYICAHLWVVRVKGGAQGNLFDRMDRFDLWDQIINMVYVFSCEMTAGEWWVVSGDLSNRALRFSFLQRNRCSAGQQSIVI